MENLVVKNLEKSWNKIYKRVKRLHKEANSVDQNNPLCRGWNAFPDELTPVTRKMQEYYKMLMTELNRTWEGTSERFGFEEVAPEIIKNLKYLNHHDKNKRVEVDDTYLHLCAYADFISQKMDIISRCFNGICIEERYCLAEGKKSPAQEDLFMKDMETLIELDIVFEDSGHIEDDYSKKQYKFYHGIIDGNVKSINASLQKA